VNISLFVNRRAKYAVEKFWNKIIIGQRLNRVFHVCLWYSFAEHDEIVFKYSWKRKSPIHEL
jgi:hypothetical protein